MEAEMAEQPATLEDLIRRRAELQPAIKRCFQASLAGTVIVARGSSDHAATCGRYLLEVATHRPVTSASPSVHLLYRAEVDFSGYVVIAVSQSGRTPEIASVLERVTAGALGFLGALLGTVGGYVALIGWLRGNSLNGGISSLGNVPVADLLFILLAMPAFATAVAWVFAGSEPTSMTHQPIE